MKRLFLFFIGLFFLIPIHAKLVIFTYAFNRPDFIEIQHKTFQKFLKDEYEFIIFSDATTDTMHNEIKSVCDLYNLKCIRIPQEIHDKPYLERLPNGFGSHYHSASVRNCNVVQYSLDILGFDHDDILVLIDSDMFLIQELSIRSYLDGFDIAAFHMACNAHPPHNCSRKHPRIKPFEYLWIGIVFMDMRTMPNKKSINFNCGQVFRNIEVDSGGYTIYYLQKNPTVKVKNISRKSMEHMVCSQCSKRPKPAPPCTHNYGILNNYGLENRAIHLAQAMHIFSSTTIQGRPSEFLMEGKFFHYRAGTNYQSFSSHYHQQRTILFNKFILDLLQS